MNMGGMSKQKSLLHLIYRGGDPDPQDPPEGGDPKPNPGDLAKKAAEKKEAGGDPDDDDLDDDDDALNKVSGTTAEQDQIRLLQTEAKNRRLKARTYKEERDAAIAEKEALERKGMDAQELLKKDLEKANTRGDEWEAVARSNALDIAVLKNKEFTWHDIDTVVSQINHEEIDFEFENGRGRVEGLEQELRRIAKDKPFLLKQAEESDEGKEKQKRKRNPTGGNPGGNQSDNDKATQRASLMKKYPYLASR